MLRCGVGRFFAELCCESKRADRHRRLELYVSLQFTVEVFASLARGRQTRLVRAVDLELYHEKGVESNEVVTLGQESGQGGQRWTSGKLMVIASL